MHSFNTTGLTGSETMILERSLVENEISKYQKLADDLISIAFLLALSLILYTAV